MIYKLLYIDDEPEKSIIQPYVSDFNSSGDLDVEVSNPIDFTAQLKEFQEKRNNYDAIILDYRLSEFANKIQDSRTFYDAPALAQDLRTKAIEEDSGIKETPIILFSSIDYLEKYYNKDLVSHDLFDMIFKKHELSKKKEQVIKQIQSLIVSYEKIENSNDLDNVLGVENSKNFLDPRFLEHYEIFRETRAIYSISTFIFRKLILATGALVDREILAARLGIDRGKSKDWSKLEELLKESKYKGVFHEAYELWWWKGVENWWKSESSPSLKGSDATSRIKYLKEKTGLDLIESTKIDLSRGDSFWTICQKLNKPIDPIDGFKIRSKNLQPWIDYKYYSLKALLEFPELIEYLQEAERKRFNQIKRSLH